MTIATGDDRYYRMALNLLKSYRIYCKNPKPFAIICDRENIITEQFDDVVLLDKCYQSFMDKIDLPINVPYDENIFIDADCLAYRDLNEYWNLFENADDFSSIGCIYDVERDNVGWFSKSGTGEFCDKIHFITHLHGGIYFIRKSDTVIQLNHLCHYIVKHYSDYTFSQFNGEPADEPVFALAMAVMNLKPEEYPPEYVCFYPSTTMLFSDITKGQLVFSAPWCPETISKGFLCHWSNYCIDQPIYKAEVYRLSALYEGRTISQ